MLITIISIIMGILFYLRSTVSDFSGVASTLGITMTIIGSLFLIVMPLTFGLSWISVQRAGQRFTPRIVELFRKDNIIRGSALWLLFFPLVTYSLALDLVAWNTMAGRIILPVWVVLFGLSLDVLYIMLKRVGSYSDPFYAVDFLAKHTRKSIVVWSEAELCNWIDAVAEIALKALQQSNISLCNHALSALPPIAGHFFEAGKGLDHPAQDTESEQMGISDKITYTLFFLLQRLDMIYEKALDHRYEPIASNVLNAFGKIAVASAHYDLSLVTYPVCSLGKDAKIGVERNLLVIGEKGSCALLEVARRIVAEVDLTYGVLKDPFLSITNYLESIATEMFKKDKTISIKVLTQPFRDLKAVFGSPNVASHADTPAIIENIDRVLNQFATLEMVLKTVPPVSIPPDLAAAARSGSPITAIPPEQER